ncbi:MAG TPA: metal ABC transporter permease, partial [Streptococcus parasuis]|nr:metal ABC transporter permease [Streptococcus parasuis]
KSFKAVIFTGMAIGFLGMVTGLMTSYYAETPASASITLIFISFFLLVNVVQKFRK